MTLPLIDLAVHGDNRGSLISLEAEKDIPFEIKRVYYIYNTNNRPRGFHAHKKLQQLLICLSGSCKIVLDDGVKRQQIILDDPSKALFVSNMIWREMHDFSNDCILVVLANEHYDENDYIRDYDEFLKVSLSSQLKL